MRALALRSAMLSANTMTHLALASTANLQEEIKTTRESESRRQLAAYLQVRSVFGFVQHFISFLISSLNHEAKIMKKMKQHTPAF